MRILHTSDWHLGGTLEHLSRDEDHRRLLRWMAQAVRDHQVDVLLIAGDIFDQAAPSAEATRLYYEFLAQLADSPLQRVIVVGGNHDSPSRLDAPRDVLAALRVTVVGGLPSQDEDRRACLVPVGGTAQNPHLVVAAVPYVHEYRLGLRPFGLDADEVRAAMTTKIRELYTSFADIGTDLARGAPLVATGHLTCLGSQLEDAPVEIHRVGNLEGFPGNTFDPRFQYVALGHIHRPQRVGQTRARYSGSPMAMNVREALTPRQVILVDVHDGGDPTVTPLSVPVIRSLVGLRGELDDVVNQLQRLSPETDLPPYVQVEVLVKHYQPSLEAKLREALAGGPFAPVLAKVHQVREMATEAPSPRTQRVRLADLSLEEVFRRRCVFRNEPADDQLLGAFRSVVSEIQTAETDP